VLQLLRDKGLLGAKASLLTNVFRRSSAWTAGKAITLRFVIVFTYFFLFGSTVLWTPFFLTGLECNSIICPEDNNFFSLEQSRARLQNDVFASTQMNGKGAVNVGLRHLAPTIQIPWASTYPFLQTHIAYAIKYPDLQSYWPETSEKAEQINAIATQLFKELFTTTQFEQLLFFIQEKTVDEESSPIVLSDEPELISIALTSQCFRFSDYCTVCKDLADLAQSYGKSIDLKSVDSEVFDQIGRILQTLAPLFKDMYEESLLLHPTEEIAMELAFLETLASNKQDVIKKIFQESIATAKTLTRYASLLSEGTMRNDSYLYWDAVITLGKAIAIQENEVDAYIERAHALFELNQVALALEDYERICAIKKKSNLLGINLGHDFELRKDDQCCSLKQFPNDYAAGFCDGAKRGSTETLDAFVRKVLTCSRGILHCLWSFGTDPSRDKNAFIACSHSFLERLKNGTSRKQLQCVVPEIKELFYTWDLLEPYEKGKKCGYIIGKYGLDIFAPLLTIKTLQHYLVFKRANTLETLKACSSEADRVKILKQSTRHAKARKEMWKAAKLGKVIAQDGNKIPYIMQKKHSWEKLIDLTGNQGNDFKQVAALLEKHNIAFRAKPIEAAQSKLKLLRSKANIQKNRIEAYFIQYKTGEVFLKNAYVR